VLTFTSFLYLNSIIFSINFSSQQKTAILVEGEKVKFEINSHAFSFRLQICKFWTSFEIRGKMHRIELDQNKIKEFELSLLKNYLLPRGGDPEEPEIDYSDEYYEHYVLSGTAN